jgi:hypothetical protein
MRWNVLEQIDDGLVTNVWNIKQNVTIKFVEKLKNYQSVRSGALMMVIIKITSFLESVHLSRFI